MLFLLALIAHIVVWFFIDWGVLASFFGIVDARGRKTGFAVKNPRERGCR